MIKKVGLSLILFGILSLPNALLAKPTVYVVNYPLQYFAERIGGDSIEVFYPNEKDFDPSFWEPDAETLEKIRQADIIFLNGADFSPWAKKVPLPRSRVINTSESFKDQYIPIFNAVTHNHPPEGKHTHGGIANYTWLNFEFAAQQAHAVKTALQRLLPKNKNAIESNFQELNKQLKNLDKRLLEMTSTSKFKPLLASHPVYQYLAKHYRLNLRYLAVEPAIYPSPQQWDKFENFVRKQPVRWLLWEGAPLEDTKNKLLKRGVNSIVFNPCAHAPAQGDFMGVMEQNLQNMKKIYPK